MDRKNVGPKKHPILFRIIKSTVRFFSPVYQISGTENLPDGPCVIIGNHSQMYGPIAAELYVSGEHYTWCISDMMDRSTVADYAFKDFWSSKPKSVRWLFWLLSRMIPPLAELIFTNASTIPVYHDTRVMSTIRQSVEKLGAGARLVIFPECGTPYNNIINDFHDHFIDIARFYYRKTGRELTFVPLYLSPRLKRMIYGRPVVCHIGTGKKAFEAERERVKQSLMDTITAIAASCPEHTVVPYPNIPKKRYPRSLPIAPASTLPAMTDADEPVILPDGGSENA